MVFPDNRFMSGNGPTKNLENLYNFDRPHCAFSGKTPYKTLNEKMKL